MKIAFDAKRAVYNRTGLGNYSRFIINGLASYFPENTYSLYSPGAGNEKLKGLITTAPCIQYRYPQQTMSRLFPAFWRSRGITADLKRDSIDLYHGLSNELPVNIQHNRIPSIVTIHDLIFLRYPQLYKWADRQIYTFKFRQACLQANKIIAISNQTKQDIIKYFNIPEKKIEVIYQGCDLVFSHPTTEAVKQSVRSKYALPSSYILYVGSIEERKNLLLLIKAIKGLKEDIQVVAIGKRTAYTNIVEQYIRENNLLGRIHLLHQIDYTELPAFYQMATLFIYPSFFEGFGIPILEAQMAGIPVIAATGSCLEEAGGPAALYTNPYNENELRGMIEAVLNEPKLAQSMSQNGLQYGKRFEAQGLAGEMIQLYQQVLSD